jgi:hypothetical protein
MNLPRCCFCGKPVLEMTGLREILTIEQMGQEEVLLDRRAFGIAHGACLVQSGHGRAWSRQKYAFMTEVRQRKALGRGTDVAGTYAEEVDEFRLFWDTGYSVDFRQPALKKAKRVVGGATVPASCEYNMEIRFQGDLLEEMRQALKHDGRYPLDHFLGRLDVGELVVYPQTLKGAYFAYDEELEKFWQDGWVSCQLVYQIFIPNSGLKLLADFGIRAAADLLSIEVTDTSTPLVEAPVPVTGLTGLPPCCFCKEPVLELEGQYSRLTEDMLFPDDFPLRREGAVGWAHASCLRRTGIGYPWSIRLLEHLQKTRGYELTGEFREAKALWDPERCESHVFWKDGYSVCARQEELHSYGLTTYQTPHWRKVLPRIDMLELDLSDYPHLEQKVRSAFENEGRYLLWDLIKGLGLSERMLYAKETLQDGVLSPEPSQESHILRMSVEYLVHIPYDGVELIALGGYPVTDAEEFLENNPHLHLKVKPREQPLNLETDDVLISFLARYEAVDPTINAAFRVPSSFLAESMSGDPGFFAHHGEWFVDQKFHKVYRLDSREDRPVEEFRSDLFLQNLLHNLPDPTRKHVRQPHSRPIPKTLN